MKIKTLSLLVIASFILFIPVMEFIMPTLDDYRVLKGLVFYILSIGLFLSVINLFKKRCPSCQMPYFKKKIRGEFWGLGLKVLTKKCVHCHYSVWSGKNE